MATDPNPLTTELGIEERRKLFNEMDYGNMHGVRCECVFPGGGTEIKVKHQFPFTPEPGALTIRPHLAMGDTGTVYMTRAPDDTYVYLAAPRAGTVNLEIAHPPKT